MIRAALYIILLMGWSAEAADLRATVYASYRAFVPLLKVVRQLPEFQDLSAEEKEVYNGVLRFAESGNISLEMDPEPANFELGEAARLMRITPIDGASNIYVNQQLLASETQAALSLPFFLKTIFHEVSHKTKMDWGLRDRVGQFFESQLTRFAPPPYELADGSQLSILSVQEEDLKSVIADVSLLRAQPTNIVILERQGVAYDLTEALNQSMEGPSTVLRTLFTEGNRMALEIYKVMSQQMRTQVLPQLRQSFAGQNIDVSPITNSFDTFLRDLYGEDSGQLRVLELHDVDSLEADGQLFVRIKANYRLKQTGIKKMNLDFGIPNLEVKSEGLEGLDVIDKVSAPVTILLRLKSSGPVAVQPADLQMTLRPALDANPIAKVKTIRRDSDDRVSAIGVQFQSELPARRAFLSVVYEGGSRSIEASSIERIGGSAGWRAEFDIPWRTLPASSVLMAESLILDTERAAYLDRMVQLNAGVSQTAKLLPPTTLVKGTSGIWAQNSGKTVFVDHFGVFNPLHLGVGKFDFNMIDPNQFAFEFQLSEPAKVVEVRLNWQRMASVLDIDSKDGRQGAIHKMLWDNEIIAIGGPGTVRSKKDIFEVLTAEGPDIFYGENRRGHNIVRVHFRAPFIAAGQPNSPNEVHGPGQVIPVVLEVVLEDGRTLVQSFGGGDCEMELSTHLKAVFEQML